MLLYPVRDRKGRGRCRTDDVSDAFFSVASIVGPMTVTGGLERPCDNIPPASRLPDVYAGSIDRLAASDGPRRMAGMQLRRLNDGTVTVIIIGAHDRRTARISVARIPSQAIEMQKMPTSFLESTKFDTWYSQARTHCVRLYIYIPDLYILITHSFISSDHLTSGSPSPLSVRVTELVICSLTI